MRKSGAVEEWMREGREVRRREGREVGRVGSLSEGETASKKK